MIRVDGPLRLDALYKDRWREVGTTTTGLIVASSRENSVVVFKRDGGHYYGGLGQPFNYARGAYHVLHVALGMGTDELVVRELAQFPLTGQEAIWET